MVCSPWNPEKQIVIVLHFWIGLDLLNVSFDCSTLWIT